LTRRFITERGSRTSLNLGVKIKTCPFLCSRLKLMKTIAVWQTGLIILTAAKQRAFLNKLVRFTLSWLRHWYWLDGWLVTICKVQNMCCKKPGNWSL
jgi:hypothetical protein